MPEKDKGRFPRKMKRGIFMGQTFQTHKDYMDALDAARNGHARVDTKDIRKVMDLYDLFRSEGLGKEKVAQLIKVAMG